MHSDIITDNAIVDFLNSLRGFNAGEKDRVELAYAKAPKLSSPATDRLVALIRENEEDESLKGNTDSFIRYKCIASLQ